MRRKIIGLSLGSGGIRGFAAFPVIHRLQEEGFQIEAASGSSIGALIGAYLALNGEVDSLWDELKDKRKKDHIRLLDPNNPRRSLIKGTKLKAFLRDSFFQDKTFADCKIPLYICAADFRTKKPVYISEGIILDAVMASISMPGIFPPYETGGNVYIDGGVLDPVPTSILLENNCNSVIGINFMGFKVQKQPEKTTLLTLLLTSYYMMMGQMTSKKSSKSLYMLNIDFKPDPANMVSFWKNKSYYQAGEQAIQNNLPDIEAWLAKEKGN